MAARRGFLTWLGGLVTRPSDSQDDGAPNLERGADLPPDTLVGEYAVVRKLGEGGFGAVYEATHPVIGKRAAVKVLHAQYSSNDEIVSRFVDEARAVNQIRHRNIVDIFAFGALEDGRHYYVMELLEGLPLDEYLDRAGRLDPDEALPLLHAIARALEAAHKEGIAHRDLKPENVFLEIDEEGAVRPKILDFGVAKLLSPGGLTPHKTRSGTPIGSPRYMSPEQCRGVEVDHRTDVYAFGAMTHRMLAGVLPFEARTALELMMMHVSVPAPAMSSVCSAVLPALDEPVLKMLEKEPDRRPQSMLAAYEALAQAVERAGLPVPAQELKASRLFREMLGARRSRTPTPFARSRPRPRRPSGSAQPRRRASPVAWLALALAAGGLAGGLVASRRLRTGTPAAGPLSAAPMAQVVAAPPAVASSPPEASGQGAGEPDALPGSVTIVVRSQPSRADVYWNDQKLGAAPGPLVLPRGDDPQTLVVKAPGHAPATVQVRPSADATVDVTLKPLPQRAPRSGVPRDLEDPYN